MSFDTPLYTLEGTILPDLDDLIEAVVQEQSFLMDEDGFEHMFFPQGITWLDGRQGKEAYRNYRDSTGSTAHMYYSGTAALKESREVLDYNSNEFYRFRYTDTNIHCSHRHPQLRNLVCATSKNDIYYLCNNSIQHWCPQLRISKTILGPPLRTAHARVPSRITTMAAMDEFLLVGGEDGSFTFMNLQTCENPIFGSFIDEGYMEVNGIELSYSRTGAPHAYVSTNDNAIRCVDMGTLQTYATFSSDWFVNYTSQSPDGHMIGIVGDDQDGRVMSVNSRETIATLKGHQRYSFAVAWSPDSTMLATGSDDMSTCIYDTRMMQNPVHIISRDIRESVRSLRYSSCGRYLVMAEDRDYVHIVDTASDYSKAQKIDFVGDISGISLTPDGDGLFVGVSSTVDFSSILEFERLNQTSNKMFEDDLWGAI
ncbi:hypothetical protein BGZ54_006839 [Gamsiella multidivaricata]|nr:hypothetical protein BGZ54_006839 [Gamsiella multidivaricata]